MLRRLLFDSHLDLAWNAIAWKRDLRLGLAEINRAEDGMTDRLGRGRATVSLPAMREGRVAVCLGTMMARVPYGTVRQVHGDSLDFPAHENAYAFAFGQLGYYHALRQAGLIRLLGTREDLASHIAAWETPDGPAREPLGIILAMEGADAITTPEQAEHWFTLGLRCVSIVHYGCSAYAAGTGEEGPVTHDGRRLLAELRRLGYILDLTHLSDTSFFQVVDLFDGPVLASHQNCRALVSGQRQFSDEQIRIVLRRGGVLGVALDAWMLYDGWRRGTTIEELTDRSVVTIDAVADHIDHICQLAGNSDQVAIGSDLDGGFGTEQTPTGLDSIADLQKLVAILANRGYSDPQIDSILYQNWQRFFEKHLPAKTME
jgi:membrane dipeptidase